MNETIQKISELFEFMKVRNLEIQQTREEVVKLKEEKKNELGNLKLKEAELKDRERNVSKLEDIARITEENRVAKVEIERERNKLAQEIKAASDARVRINTEIAEMKAAIDDKEKSLLKREDKLKADQAKLKEDRKKCDEALKALKAKIE